ncbi:MAG: transcription factor S [Desulfurococcales archaeon]|nr:transcription factor S [Desulfurococcales archaeon]
MVVTCPKCGGIMVPRRIKGKTVLYCIKCGYTMDVNPEAASKMVRREKITRSPRDKIIVVEEGPPPGASVLKGSVRCPKCGFDEVYYWMMQTRAADEPMTRFYRCKRCGYTWREYD